METVLANKIDLSEQRLETENEVINGLDQFFEQFNNRFDIKDFRLVDSYIEGKVCILVHIRLAEKNYVVLFERLHEIGQSKPRDGRMKHGKLGKMESHFIHADNRSEQSMVLVGNVELMETPERIIPALIRLSTPDCIYSGLRHAHYLSLMSGIVERGGISNRECGLRGRSSAVDQNKLIGEMVKAGSEIVDYVARDDSDFFRRSTKVTDIKGVVSSLRVKLGFDCIRLTLHKTIPSNHQFVEVLIGPVDFKSDE